MWVGVEFSAYRILAYDAKIRINANVIQSGAEIDERRKEERVFFRNPKIKIHNSNWRRVENSWDK